MNEQISGAIHSLSHPHLTLTDRPEDRSLPCVGPTATLTCAWQNVIKSPSYHKQALDTVSGKSYGWAVEKIITKRPLDSEGIPPLIGDPQQALEVFEEILKRGAFFYPQSNETSPRHPRVYRIVSLAES